MTECEYEGCVRVRHWISGWICTCCGKHDWWPAFAPNDYSIKAKFWRKMWKKFHVK